MKNLPLIILAILLVKFQAKADPIKDPFVLVNNLVDSIYTIKPHNQDSLTHTIEFNNSISKKKPLDTILYGASYVAIAKAYRKLKEHELEGANYLKAAEVFEWVEKPEWDQHIRYYFNALYRAVSPSEKEALFYKIKSIHSQSRYKKIAISHYADFLLADLQDYSKALDFISTEFELFQNQPNIDSYVEMATMQLKALDKAEQYDVLTVNSANNLYNNLINLGYSPNEDLYLALGNYYKNAGQIEQSIDVYEQAHTIGYKRVLNSAADACLIEGDIECARRYSLQALQVATLSTQSKANAEHNLGDSYFKAGDIDNAIYWFKKSLLTKGGVIERNGRLELTNVSTGNVRSNLYTFLHFLAQAYAAKGKNELNKHTKDALYYFGLCDLEIERKRIKNIREESKLHWQEKVYPIYQDAINTAYYAEDWSVMQKFMERSKAALLLHQFNASLEISPEINSQRKELAYNLSDAQRKKDNDAVRRVMQFKLDSLNNLLPQNPKWLQTKTLLEARQELKPPEIIISYAWSKKGFIALAITKENSQVWRIDIEDIEALNEQIVGLSTKNSLKAGALKQEVLIPIDIQEYEHIIILPDGPLNYIPFEALIDKNGDYLIENHTISYGFSASTYFAEKNATPSKQLLAFGPSSYSDSLQLTPLSETNFELAALKPFKTQFYKGEKATKANLLNAWQNKKIIHISSHGQANDKGYNHPWVAAFDDKIYLPEIYNQQLNTDLVVLSACETSLGEEVKGEGVISLARGFFHAGANSVMASLWQVNEQSTAIITRSFYKHLNKGKTKAEALRYAKLDFIRDYPEYANQPHYWAGLIYIGEDGKLPLPRNNRRLLWLLLLIPVGIMAHNFWQRKAA